MFGIDNCIDDTIMIISSLNLTWSNAPSLLLVNCMLIDVFLPGECGILSQASYPVLDKGKVLEALKIARDEEKLKVTSSVWWGA